MRLATLAAATVIAGFAAGEAAAQSRCRVMDPTGTPLNIRGGPNGPIIGKAENGALVSILETTRDARGRAWVYVAHRASGEPLGWVYREFIACF